MPTFTTPEPISITLDLFIGDTHITAEDRTDTIVEITPTDETSTADMRAAEQTTVEHSNGRLVVKTPRRRANMIGLGSGKDASIQVRVTVPAGSRVHGSCGLGDFHCAGRLGDCELTTGAGTIGVERAGAIRLNSGGGDITVGRAAGDAQATTGIGEIRIAGIDGTAVIKNSAGGSWVGEVRGDTRVRSASGQIVIDRAGAAVDAKTSAGKIRVGEVRQGAITLQSAAGDVHVGVRPGTAAWIDAYTSVGGVHNQLEHADGPGEADRTVEVRARTHLGDIVIGRSPRTPEDES